MTKSNLKESINLVIAKLKFVSNTSTDVSLATVMGVDRTIFSSWKNQSKIIPIENIIEFSKKYNVSIDWLLTNNDFPNTEDTEIKIPFYKDYNFDASSGYLVLPRATLKLSKRQNNIRAIMSVTTELPNKAPIGSTIFYDFDDDKVTQSPQVFLVSANGNYFLREVTVTPELDYFLSSENDKIQSMRVEYNKIEILAKVIGVTKWEN